MILSEAVVVYSLVCPAVFHPLLHFQLKRVLLIRIVIIVVDSYYFYIYGLLCSYFSADQQQPVCLMGGIL